VRLVLVDDANKTATIDGEDVTFEAALAEARDADAVVMMAGTISTEGADRVTFTDTTGRTRVDIGDDLDWYVDNSAAVATVDGTNPAKNSNTVAMIKAVMDASPTMAEKTTLVLKDNAGVAMDPALVGESGPAILEAWFPGQEDGNIVADLLFGRVNPSGKSPVTYPYAGKGFLDNISTLQYPGDMVDGEQTVEYTEKLNMGYRWYDSNLSGDCPTIGQGANPCVAFPFGHGLSYSTFEISNLTVTPKVSDGKRPIKVQFLVENTGDVAGAEVPQVYLSLPESVDAPPKRLVGFDKVALQPGEKKRVEITVDPAASNHPLSVWSDDADTWRTPVGEFAVQVGNSSGNLALADTFVTIRAPRALGR
jgi:beta-glucosidase